MTVQDQRPHFRRAIFAAFIAIAIAAGLASRKFSDHLPQFLADHFGDAAWAAMIFFIIGFLTPTTSLSWRVICSMLFCFIIETSQLYHAPWIDSIRSTTLGGLVLGYQFVWVDLLRYSVGIGVATAIEYAVFAGRSK